MLRKLTSARTSSEFTDEPRDCLANQHDQKIGRYNRDMPFVFSNYCGRLAVSVW